MLCIQRAGEKDAGEIAALEGEVFSDAWGRQGVCDTLKNPGASIFCAWEEGQLIGYLILYFVLDEGEIARIAVRKPSRRKGAAGKLLGRALEFCAEKEIRTLFLEVRKSNAPAIAFYRKWGFKEDGIRKNFYTDPPEDAILMSCSSSWRLSVQ